MFGNRDRNLGHLCDHAEGFEYNFIVMKLNNESSVINNSRGHLSQALKRSLEFCLIDQIFELTYMCSFYRG